MQDSKTRQQIRIAKQLAREAQAKVRSNYGKLIDDGVNPVVRYD